MDTRQQRPPGARARRGLTALLAATLVAGTLYAAPALAAPTDALNVGFGGSLTPQGYTTVEGEVMKGTLIGATTQEQQTAGVGIVLAGGKQGLVFTPSADVMPSVTNDTSFLAEVTFKPTANQTTEQATLFSWGGAFSVRYQSGKLFYGFDYLNNGTWGKANASTDIPEINKVHNLSLQYNRSATQTTVDVMLDGVHLDQIATPFKAELNSAVSGKFGYGNDVHPGGNTRGFVGEISRARLANAPGTYDARLFEYQPEPPTKNLLNTAFAGTFGSEATPTYVAVPADDVLGTLKLAKAGTTAAGAVTFNDNSQALDFRATDAPWSAGALDKSFIAEVEYTPSGNPDNLDTIFGIGGNLFVRAQNNQLRYGYSAGPLPGSSAWNDFVANTTLPASGAKHVISLAYLVAADNTVTLRLWIDGTEAPAVTGSRPSTPSSTAANMTVGNDANPGARERGYPMVAHKARLAMVNAPFDVTMIKLQTIVVPENCDDMSAVQPANYIPVSSADCRTNVLKKAALVRPTEGQLSWQEDGLTAFVHFGINTFVNQEWTSAEYPASRFNPTGNLDPDVWVKTLRDQGYRYVVLTVKHHDGFVSYPSRYTDYGVKSSPWLNGKGDVVKMLTDAAHKYGMKVGMYLSPADSNAEKMGIFGNGSPKTDRPIPTLVEGDDRAGNPAYPSFTYKATDYGQYFLNQLYEVLTQYGQVDEVWFDGAQGNTTKPETYDYPAFYDLIGKLQPKALVAVGGRDIRWIGNESGQARENEWGPQAINNPADGGQIGLSDPGQTSWFDQLTGSDARIVRAAQTGANSLHWWPVEADMKLTGGWFAYDGNVGKDVPKTPAALMGHYMNTVGKNAVMLLNVPPTITGQFSQPMINSITGFASERRKAFTVDRALGVPVSVDGTTDTTVTDGNIRTGVVAKATTGQVSIDLGTPRTIRRIALSENTGVNGQVVTGFNVEAKVNGAWSKVGEAGTIGVSRILQFSSDVTASEFRVNITGARAPFSLANLSLYEQLASDPGKASEVWVDCSAPTAGDGTMDRPFNSMAQFRQFELAPSAKIHVKAGSQCAAYDGPIWAYGTTAKPVLVDTYGGTDAATIGGASLADFVTRFSGQNISVPGAPVPAPAFTTQPANVSVTEGQTATFTVAVDDATDVTMRWETATAAAPDTWTTVTGATSTTLTLSSTTMAQNQQKYRAVATRGDKTATSDAATLTVTKVVVPANPTVTVTSPDNFQQGGHVVVKGADWPAGTVQIELHSDPVVLGTVTVGADGTFEFTGTIPADIPVGEHTIVVVQGELTKTAAITIVAKDAGPSPTPTVTPSPSVSPSVPASTTPSVTPGPGIFPPLPKTDGGAMGVVAVLALLATAGVALVARKRRG